MENERGRKKKLQESIQIKEEVNILIGEKHFQPSRYNCFFERCGYASWCKRREKRK
jgi:hypothetical protein